ncbi:hypothetical protein L7F22_015064 [Adiantum nelumboides]|nr:hypothetical protein [Adiantum nelumboides]
MHLVNCGNVQCESNFAKWVLDIGNGNVATHVFSDDIALPVHMLLEGNSVQSMVNFIYANLSCIDNFADFFQERAILAPRNKDVDVINSLALGKLDGASKEYRSADSITSLDDRAQQLYTLEFLNNLDLGGGFPPHVLILKENAPIILLRNLDPRRGLCNGTRLICKQMYERVIEAEIITGKNAKDIVFIPRIDFNSPSSLGLPFEMKRMQFPIKLAFGMTINTAQGQTLENLGLYLSSPVFSHGQLHVAMSRVRSSNAIKVVVDDRKLERQQGTTEVYARIPNVVYKGVLQLAH